jgi:hypothetical protein
VLRFRSLSLTGRSAFLNATHPPIPSPLPFFFLAGTSQTFDDRHYDGLSLHRADVEAAAPWVVEFMDSALAPASSLLPAAIKLFQCFRVCRLRVWETRVAVCVRGGWGHAGAGGYARVPAWQCMVTRCPRVCLGAAWVAMRVTPLRFLGLTRSAAISVLGVAQVWVRFARIQAGVLARSKLPSAVFAAVGVPQLFDVAVECVVELVRA